MPLPTPSNAAPAQLRAPSPCTAWTRRDVLNHMIGAADMFAACARGEEPQMPDRSDMPDWVGADPATSYRRSTAALIAAYSVPGVLEGNVPMPWAAMPGTFALDLVTADHVTHSWDLAMNGGLSIAIEHSAAEVALEVMQASISPEQRSAGFYGPEQPAREGAAAIDRLAAFTGRPL